MGSTTALRGGFGTLAMSLALGACGAVRDRDDDGFGDDVDCDDEDASVHPDNREIADDGIDNDCDAAVDCDDTELTVVWLGDLTDAELDGFCDHACSRTVSGDVRLDGTSRTDLDDLSCLTAVEGSVYVRRNRDLASIEGLARLRSVGGDLLIGDYWCVFDDAVDAYRCDPGGNPELASLSGLGALESVGGVLWIGGNESLVDGARFDALTAVGSDVVTWSGLAIEGNPALTQVPEFPLLTSVSGLSLWGGDALGSVAGLGALSDVGGHVYVVENASLADLAGLEALETIGGNLVVQRTSLTSLAGLAGLRSVGLTLQVEDNDALTSLDGLASLTSVGQGLDPAFGADELTDGVPGAWWRAVAVFGNELLVDLHGLDQLTVTRDCLCVWDNPNLASLDGVGSLVETGALSLAFNPRLASLEGLGSLQRVNYEIELFDNDALTTLAGLEQVDEVGRYLVVSANDGLTSLSGLDALQTVPDMVQLEQNPALTDLQGLDTLTSIGPGGLSITSNAGLVDLDGLGSLSSVAGPLWLADNASLVTLDGLDGLTQVGGNLAIGWSDWFDEPAGNPALADVTALYGLQAVDGDVYITANPQLGEGRAYALVDEIASIGGFVYVAGNQP